MKVKELEEMNKKKLEETRKRNKKIAEQWNEKIEDVAKRIARLFGTMCAVQKNLCKETGVTVSTEEIAKIALHLAKVAHPNPLNALSCQPTKKKQV